jgi:hypothetical protein
MKIAIFAAAAQCFTFAADASAQITEEQRAALEERHNRLVELDRTRNAAIGRPDRWQAVFSRVDAFGSAWVVIAFGREGEQRGPRTWRAERRNSESHIVWEATAAQCPALLDFVEAIELLSPPQVDIWGIGAERPPSIILTPSGPMQVVPAPVLDGYDYRLWTWQATYAPNVRGEVEFSGNVDSPLATWADAMMSNLEPCWRQVR